jgi:DNA primase
VSKLDRAFLDEVLNRTSILDVVGRKVSWDRRKSVPARGDMWACCPFHKEDTPSFHAVESRGAYHCFGCGAHGNAFDFVMAQDNLGFMEAVERLARDAGLAMPERDPQAEQKLEAGQRLYRALEAAQACFAEALRSGDGAKARAYLEKRGLPEGEWDRFAIGWAPASGSWLRERLTAAGHKLADLLEAGLVRQPDDGRQPYDFYRGRVTFAVTDTRGRVVAFGARTLDPDGTPKYLNGPETPVFSKSRNLYRFFEARPLARSAPLLIAEGYLDVIALERAGWPAVAPLGTALTEDQLALAWKAHRRPIVCLDGDGAGLRAAGRALERALPLVSAERSLGFAILPQGQDPDDLLRADGKAGMQKVLEAALPLGAFLVRHEAGRETLDTAEARAGLRKRLRFAVSGVKDPDLQAELKADVAERTRELFGRGQRARHGSDQPARPDTWTGSQRGRGRSWRPGERDPQAPASTELREMAPAAGRRAPKALVDLVTAPIRLPSLLETGWEALSALMLDDPGLDSLRQVMLHRYAAGDTIEFGALRHHLAAQDDERALAVLQAAQSSPINPFTRADDRPEDSARAWLGALHRAEAHRALTVDALETRSALASGDGDAMQRLQMLKREQQRVGSTGEVASAAGSPPHPTEA